MSGTEVRVIDAYVFIKTKSGLKYLLLKRAEEKIYGGLWQCVTGKIEADEPAWKTAVRELKEETGLTPINMFVADHVSQFYEANKNRMNLIPVFGIEVESDEVKLSDEHSKFVWADFDFAFKKLVWRGQKDGLFSVNNMLSLDDGRILWSKILL
ncbi:NUDIX domain-containing protein [Candidatus Marinimicrobia bacterium]|jgi:dATP pyrophosphohydrolase|nr:NUDIX domain-containing protein [Candidatus Neomarinimicrobiota bacterium]MDA8753923.1 NUDIX domain-containing protein [Candidatus Neomarinimicrobiota bacterium]MDC0383833.1 NUDIX domain-containing protein [Candidatus Neomarinimicrobiota bacterium]